MPFDDAVSSFLAGLGKRIGKATGEAVSCRKRQGFLSEVFKGSKIIRIYQKEFEESKRANSIIDELLNKGIKWNCDDKSYSNNGI